MNIWDKGQFFRDIAALEDGASVREVVKKRYIVSVFSGKVIRANSLMGRISRLFTSALTKHREGTEFANQKYSAHDLKDLEDSDYVAVAKKLKDAGLFEEKVGGESRDLGEAKHTLKAKVQAEEVARLKKSRLRRKDLRDVDRELYEKVMDPEKMLDHDVLEYLGVKGTWLADAQRALSERCALDPERANTKEERREQYRELAKKYAEKAKLALPGMPMTFVGSMGHRKSNLSTLLNLFTQSNLTNGDAGFDIREMLGEQGQLKNPEDIANELIDKFRSAIPEMDQEEKAALEAVAALFLPREGRETFPLMQKLLPGFVNREAGHILSSGALGIGYEFLGDGSRQGLDLLFAMAPLFQGDELRKAKLDELQKILITKGISENLEGVEQVLGEVFQKAEQFSPFLMEILQIDQFFQSSEILFTLKKERNGSFTLEMCANKSLVGKRSVKGIYPDADFFARLFENEFEPSYDPGYTTSASDYLLGLTGGGNSWKEEKTSLSPHLTIEELIVADRGRNGADPATIAEKKLDALASMARKSYDRELLLKGVAEVKRCFNGKLTEEAEATFFEIEKMVELPKEKTKPPLMPELGLPDFVIRGMRNASFEFGFTAETLQGWVDGVNWAFGPDYGRVVSYLAKVMEEVEKLGPSHEPAPPPAEPYERQYVQRSMLLRALASTYATAVVKTIQTGMMLLTYAKLATECAGGNYFVIGHLVVKHLTPIQIREWVAGVISQVQWTVLGIFLYLIFKERADAAREAIQKHSAGVGAHVDILEEKVQPPVLEVKPTQLPEVVEFSDEMEVIRKAIISDFRVEELDLLEIPKRGVAGRWDTIDIQEIPKVLETLESMSKFLEGRSDLVSLIDQHHVLAITDCLLRRIYPELEGYETGAPALLEYLDLNNSYVHDPKMFIKLQKVLEYLEPKASKMTKAERIDAYYSVSLLQFRPIDRQSHKLAFPAYMMMDKKAFKNKKPVPDAAEQIVRVGMRCYGFTELNDLDLTLTEDQISNAKEKWRRQQKLPQAVGIALDIKRTDEQIETNSYRFYHNLTKIQSPYIERVINRPEESVIDILQALRSKPGRAELDELDKLLFSDGMLAKQLQESPQLGEAIGDWLKDHFQDLSAGLIAEWNQDLYQGIVIGLYEYASVFSPESKKTLPSLFEGYKHYKSYTLLHNPGLLSKEERNKFLLLPYKGLNIYLTEAWRKEMEARLEEPEGLQEASEAIGSLFYPEEPIEKTIVREEFILVKKKSGSARFYLTDLSLQITKRTERRLHSGPSQVEGKRVRRAFSHFVPKKLIKCYAERGEKTISKVSIPKYNLLFSPKNGKLAETKRGYTLSERRSHSSLKGFGPHLLLEDQAGGYVAAVPKKFYSSALAMRQLKNYEKLAPFIRPLLAKVLHEYNQDGDGVYFVRIDPKTGVLSSDDPGFAMEYAIHQLLYGNASHFNEFLGKILTEPVDNKSLMLLLGATFAVGKEAEGRALRLKLYAALEESVAKGMCKVPKKLALPLILYDLTELQKMKKRPISAPEEYLVFALAERMIGYRNLGTPLLTLVSSALADRYIALCRYVGKQPSTVENLLKMVTDIFQAPGITVPAGSTLILEQLTKVIPVLSQESAIELLTTLAKNIGAYQVNTRYFLSEEYVNETMLKEGEVDDFPLTEESVSKNFFRYYLMIKENLEGKDKLVRSLYLSKGGWSPHTRILIDILIAAHEYPWWFPSAFSFHTQKKSESDVVKELAQATLIARSTLDIGSFLKGKFTDYYLSTLIGPLAFWEYLPGMFFARQGVFVGTKAVGALTKKAPPEIQPEKKEQFVLDQGVREELFKIDDEIGSMLRALFYATFESKTWEPSNIAAESKIGKLLATALKNKMEMKLSFKAEEYLPFIERVVLDLYDVAAGELKGIEQDFLAMVGKEDILPYYQSLLSGDIDMIEPMKNALIKALALKVRVQQLARVKEYAANRNIEKIAEGLSAIHPVDFKNDTDRMIIAALLIETGHEIMLWPKQMDVARNVLATSDVSKVHEAIMGIGKSTEIIPLENAVRGDGKTLVLNIWPASHAGMNTSYMTREMGSVYGILQHALQVSSKNISGDNLRSLYAALCAMKENGEGINLTKMDLQKIQSLFLLELNKDLEADQEVLNALTDIQKLLKSSNGRGVIDETQDQFFHLDQYNFPVGNKEKLPREYVLPIKKAMKALYTDARFLGAVRARTTLRFLHEEYEEVKGEAVEKLLARHSLSNSQWEEAREYLIGVGSKPEWMRGHADELNFAAYRGVFVDLVPSTLEKDVSVHYGSSDKDSISHPYGGNNVCREEAVDTLPHQTLVRTLMKDLALGLSDKKTKVTLQLIKKRLQKDPKFGDKFVFIPGMTEYLEGATPSPELIQAASKDPKIIDFYTYALSLNEIKYWKENISNNSWTFAGMLGQYTGYSGIPYNADTYPEMKLQRDEGSMGDAVATVLKRGAPDVTVVGDNPLEETLMAHFKTGSKACALHDPEAVLAGIPNREVALRMAKHALQHAPSIKGIVFIENDKQYVCSVQNGHTILPFTEQMMKPEERYTYYDQSHCFATNIVQRADGVGVVLVSRKKGKHGTPLALHLQGPYRMRGLGKKNRLDEAAIFQTIQYVSQEPTTPDEILATRYNNELEVTQDSNDHSHLSKMRNVMRQESINLILSASPTGQTVYFNRLREFIIDRVPDSPLELWGEKEEEMPPREHFKRVAAGILARAKKTGLFSDADLAKIEQKLQAPQNLPLPDLVLVKPTGAIQGVMQSEQNAENQNQNLNQNRMQVHGTRKNLPKKKFVKHKWPSLHQNAVIASPALLAKMPVKQVVAKEVQVPDHCLASKNFSPYESGSLNQYAPYSMLVYLDENDAVEKTVLLNRDDSTLWHEKLSKVNGKRKALIWDLRARVVIAGSQVPRATLLQSEKLQDAEAFAWMMEGAVNPPKDLIKPIVRNVEKDPEGFYKLFQRVVENRSETSFQGSKLEKIALMAISAKRRHAYK